MAWSDRLSRQIKLANNRGTLTTLREAAEFVQSEFKRVIRDQALDATVEYLMTAAETGKLADRRAATDQLSSFLNAQRMLAGQKTEDIQARFRRMVEAENGERPKRAAAKSTKRTVRRSR